MSEWFPADSPLRPKPEVDVLVACRHALGKRRFVTVARWVGARTCDDGGYEGDDADYDEETGAYWWPEGWYENYEFASDEVWRIPDGNVLAWMPMPRLPEERV